MNRALPRVIAAPLTSEGQPSGCRPEVMKDGGRAYYSIRFAASTGGSSWEGSERLNHFSGIRCWCRCLGRYGLIQISITVRLFPLYQFTTVVVRVGAVRMKSK